MTSKHSSSLSVVIPVLNEANTLPELYSRLTKVANTAIEPYEFIFIDDGSSDDSFRVLAGLQQADSRVAVIQLRRSYGKAAALAMGFQEARGDLIITLDADLQDQPEEIPQLVAKLNEGYDLVAGWRVKRQDGFGKILASRLFNTVTSWLSGVRLHDINCGLKVLRREVLDSLNMRGELHRYIPVLVQWQGFKVGEVAVQHQPRRYGKSKYGSERFLRGFFDLVTVMVLTRYLRRPLHLFGGIGLVLSGTGLSINLYLAIGWVLRKWWLGDRPLLLFGALLMIIGIQFVLFGLLAEMVLHDKQDEAEVAVRTRLRREE